MNCLKTGIPSHIEKLRFL